MAGPEVKVTVTVNCMHDQLWTDRQRMDSGNAAFEAGQTHYQQEAIMTTINPFLWFDKQAEEAANF